MIARWQVVYFCDQTGKSPVQEFLNNLPGIQQRKIYRIFQYIQEYGLDSVISHLRKISGTPFWEIRILGKDNIRIIYIGIKDNKILVLHGFIKKSQKTPLSDLKICIKRYSNWLAA